MLKITKISASVLIFYVLFYLQVWGDNHIILYGTAVISVASMLIYCFEQGKLDLSNVPFGIWNNLMMVVYCLITGFFVSYNYSATISGCITYAAFSFVCIAICYASSEEGSFDWVIRILIALAIIDATYTLFRGYDLSGYGRVLSSTNNPHTLAAVMNLGIFSVVFIRRNKERVTSLLSILLIFYFFYTIIECGSRKYLLASSCLVVLFFAAFFKERWTNQDNQQKIILIVISILFFFLSVYLFRKVYSQSYTYLRMEDMDNSGNQKRIMYYRQAWDIFLDHPFFGGGYDQFRYLTDGSYAHSTYAEAISDFGFVGCLLYFIPIINTSYQIIYKAFITEKKYSTILLAALCISELFLGVGQIFFMEFYHFLAWTILFFYSETTDVNKYETYSNCKYIRNF